MSIPQSFPLNDLPPYPNNQPPTEIEMRKKIRCDNIKVHNSSNSSSGNSDNNKESPQATYCCIKCEMYLCNRCYKGLHNKVKHGAVQLNQLKSYIVFTEKQR
jgi:hypothetical protein